MSYTHNKITNSWHAWIRGTWRLATQEPSLTARKAVEGRGGLWANVSNFSPPCKLFPYSILSKDLKTGIRDWISSMQLTSLALEGRASAAALTLASTGSGAASLITSLEDLTHPPITNFWPTNARPPSWVSKRVLRRTRLEYLEKVTGVKTVGCWAAIGECGGRKRREMWGLNDEGEETWIERYRRR